MNDDEATKCVDKIAKLWPKWHQELNQEQTDEWCIALLKFKAPDVLAAIENHFRDPKRSTRPSLGAMLASLQGKTVDRAQVPERGHGSRFVDFARNQMNGDARNKSDVWVIATWHRRVWSCCPKSAGYKTKVQTECRGKLVELGLSDTLPALIAECVTGDAETFDQLMQQTGFDCPKPVEPRQNESIIEWLLRRQLADPFAVSVSPVSAVIDHFTDAKDCVIVQTRKGSPEQMTALRMVLTHFRGALTDAGVDYVEADEMALALSGLTEAQVATRSSFLRPVEEIDNGPMERARAARQQVLQEVGA